MRAVGALLRGALGALATMVAGVLAPVAARAQVSSVIAVDAEISTTLLSIANPQQLQFGTVIPGTPLTLNPVTAATVGKFVVHGNRNAELSVTFVLPASLVVGPYLMPISFGATSACWRTRDQQALCTPYDPHTALVQRIRNTPAPNNTLVVWIGGTVSPTPTQHPGFYAATITLAAVYTGN